MQINAKGFRLGSLSIGLFTNGGIEPVSTRLTYFYMDQLS